MGKLKKALFKFKPFSKKQLKVLTWHLDNSPVNDYDGIIADGAIRSGKTVSMSFSYVAWAMKNFNNEIFAICGKTVGSCRRNVIKPLLSMLRSEGFKVKDHKSDNLITITKNGVTNDFYIFGGKDEASQDLIQGITLAGIFFDEVVLMPQSFVNQGTGRCSVEGSKFWFNCNPEGPYHWFKTEWIDKVKEKNLLYLHFTMDDNLSLGEKIKNRYRSMYSGVFYDRYIKGLWTIAEGIIYSMFSNEDNIVEASDHDFTRYYVSCDYGTQNACVFGLWGKTIDNNYIMIKEYYYSGRDTGKQKTDQEYSEDMKAFTKGYNISQIILDPSATSFKTQLQKDGFKVKPAKNDVVNGIRLVAKFLLSKTILFDNSCKNTFKEFSSYVWDEKASMKGEDKPIKNMDHSMDQIRYFCNTIIHKPTGLSVFK